jgi:hypothetical protein
MCQNFSWFALFQLHFLFYLDFKTGAEEAS